MSVGGQGNPGGRNYALGLTGPRFAGALFGMIALRRLDRLALRWAGDGRGTREGTAAVAICYSLERSPFLHQHQQQQQR